MDSPVSDALYANIKSLRRYALAMTRDPDDADDLVQECLKRALTYIKSDNQIRNLRSYLFTILNHVYMDELAKRRQRGVTVDIDDVSDFISQPPSQIPRMSCRDLSRALERIPEEQKQVVLLVGLEGMSYRAAAQTLGVPIGTVMSRLSRGRDLLRHLMAGQGDIRRFPALHGSGFPRQGTGATASAAQVRQAADVD